MHFLEEFYTPDEWAHPTHPGRVFAESDDTVWLLAPLSFGAYKMYGIPKGADGSTSVDGPQWGWVYNTEPLLLASAMVWNPVVEDEPVGWTKRSGDLRRAPSRDDRPDYNLPRCAHGSYIGTGVCSVNDFCQEMRSTGH